MEQVLVLDAGYQPVDKRHWQKVISQVLEKVVEVVDEHPDKYIRTVNWSVKMPSVVRMLKPINKKRAVKFSRHNVFERDNGRCQYCGVKCSRDRQAQNAFTYDHVVPRSQGGQTTWTNVVVACVPCNQSKGSRTPEQAGMRLRSTPVRPKKLSERQPAMYFAPGMPESWRGFLRDAVYWNSELEE